MSDILDDLAWQTVDEMRRTKMPDDARRMIWLHLTKPWIAGFKSVLISPLRSGLEDFLARREWKDEPVVVTDTPGALWYFPSLKWWLAHARQSHKGGAGCDVADHVAFLTAEGEDAEFAYATMTQDLQIRVLKRQDFSKECSWWADFF